MRVWADLFNIYGEYQGTLNGVPIAGPLRGMQNISYTPRGARLNAAGELTFSLLLATRRATAINEGTTIRLWEDGIDQGLFIVGEGSETDDGTVATFRCADLMEELRWALVSGYANDPALTVDRAASDIVGLARDYSHTWPTGYWYCTTVPGTVGFYTGVSFVVEASSVLAALTDLSNRTGYGFRLMGAVDRILEFGDLRGDSGLRLQRPGGDASKTPRAYIRNLTGLTPKRDPQSIVTVIVPQAQGTDGANLRDIWNESGNTIVPNTDGDWHLTGPITDDWYDPAYPLIRRPRPDLKNTDGQDGWTYFVAKQGALAAKRERWQSQAFGDIRPATMFYSDRRAAAGALYRACVTYLDEHAEAHTVYDITTAGGGDNRGVAGMDVQIVDYRRKINELRTVVDVLRTVDEQGVSTDRWTVDNIGRPLRGDRHVMSDTWRQMVAMATNPRPAPQTETRVFAQHVAENASMSFVIPANPYQRRTQVIIHVAPGKDEAGSTPDYVLLLVNGYTYTGPDYPTGSSAFDADVSYVPESTTEILGLDSTHALTCAVAIGYAGNITVTCTINYTGLR